ncbi:MAG: hypothetical protein R2823_01835 [Acidimicrobiia bacterium]
MSTILLVAETPSVTDRVHVALAGSGITIIDHDDPRTASKVAYELPVDSVVTEMQVGSMGAMAIARAVRADANNGAAIPVTILLDREADAFLAGRSGAANWVDKNATPAELRKALGVAR